MLVWVCSWDCLHLSAPFLLVLRKQNIKANTSNVKHICSQPFYVYNFNLNVLSFCK